MLAGMTSIVTNLFSYYHWNRLRQQKGLSLKKNSFHLMPEHVVLLMSLYTVALSELHFDNFKGMFDVASRPFDEGWENFLYQISCYCIHDHLISLSFELFFCKFHKPIHLRTGFHQKNPFQHLILSFMG